MRIGGIVLCGGLSKRMARDKATLSFGPELMLQRTVRILSERVGPIVVAAAAGQSLPELPAEIRIAYDTTAARGPLEGLQAGLSLLAGQVEAAFCTSCDAPLLTPIFIENMLARLGEATIVVPVAGGFVHPLAGVYRLDALPAIRSLLEEGIYRVTTLFDRVPTERIPEDRVREFDPELHSLMNLNHADDYRAALKIAGFEDRLP